MQTVTATTTHGSQASRNFATESESELEVSCDTTHVLEHWILGLIYFEFITKVRIRHVFITVNYLYNILIFITARCLRQKAANLYNYDE